MWHRLLAREWPSGAVAAWLSGVVRLSVGLDHVFRWQAGEAGAAVDRPVLDGG